MSDTDVVAKFLGPYGQWQLRSTLIIYLVKIPSAWFMACLIFTAKTPTPGEIYCKPPSDIKVNDTNLWVASAHDQVYNRIEDEQSYDICNIHDSAEERYLNSSIESNIASLHECSEFMHKPIYYSIIHQYDLECSREALISLTQSFHLLGVLIGGIVAFYLLKFISPRRVMLIGLLTQIIFGLITGYAPTYELHLLFRCTVAATCSLMCIGIMIVTDITTGKYRIISICLFDEFWSIGVILLPLVGSWWQSWSLIYVAQSLPTLGILILFHWVPDSPRWLLKHGRVEEAKLILLDAARVNRKQGFILEDLNKQLYAMAEAMKSDPPEPTLLSIWKGPGVNRIALFAVHIGFSIYLMLYFTYLLHVRAMGRNYLEANTAIAGLSEVIGTFVALYLILKTTRKWLWASLLNIVTSLLAMSANLVPDSVPPFQRMIIYMITLFIAKLTVSTSLSLLIVCGSEVVAKEKKKTCSYSAVTCSRTLVIVAPFIGYCMTFGQLVPQNIMICMNLCTSLLIMICIHTPRTIPKRPKVEVPAITDGRSDKDVNHNNGHYNAACHAEN